MSTRISLKKAAPAAAVAGAPAPVTQPVAAAPVAAPVAQPAAPVVPQQVVAQAAPAETPEEREYREYQEFKRMKAAQAAPVAAQPAPAAPVAAPVPTVPVTVLPPSTPVPAQETPEQFANRTMADQIVQPPVVTQPAPAEIVTPEDQDNQTRTVTATGHFKGEAGVEGAWDNSRHTIVPRIQIVQGNGQLAARHPVSTLLLQDDVFLPAANATTNRPNVLFVPVRNRLQYREIMTNEMRNSGLKQRIAFTPEDVTAMGGTYEWKNNVRPTFEETARVVLLMHQPEGIDLPLFSEIPGLTGKYAMAVYYASGVAFAYFAKPIYSASVSTLKIANEENQLVPYLPKRWWKFNVDTRRWGNFAPWCLIANQTTQDTDAAIRAFVAPYLKTEVLDED
jgi:hypothetical protein